MGRRRARRNGRLHSGGSDNGNHVTMHTGAVVLMVLVLVTVGGLDLHVPTGRNMNWLAGNGRGRVVWVLVLLVIMVRSELCIVVLAKRLHGVSVRMMVSVERPTHQVSSLWLRHHWVRVLLLLLA